MKFVTNRKGAVLGQYYSETINNETIDFLNKNNLRTSVSFEQFIYNGEFDPGSG